MARRGRPGPPGLTPHANWPTGSLAGIGETHMRRAGRLSAVRQLGEEKIDNADEGQDSAASHAVAESVKPQADCARQEKSARWQRRSSRLCVGATPKRSFQPGQACRRPTRSQPLDATRTIPEYLAHAINITPPTIQIPHMNPQSVAQLVFIVNAFHRSHPRTRRCTSSPGRPRNGRQHSTGRGACFLFELLQFLQRHRAYPLGDIQVPFHNIIANYESHLALRTASQISKYHTRTRSGSETNFDGRHPVIAAKFIVEAYRILRISVDPASPALMSPAPCCPAGVSMLKL